MKCKMECRSKYDGENISFDGTIEVDGTTYTLDCQGDCSSRGIYATVNGESKWWCGSDHPGSDGPENVEAACEDLLSSVWVQVEDQRHSADGTWVAKVVDGKVVSVETKEW